MDVTVSAENQGCVECVLQKAGSLTVVFPARSFYLQARRSLAKATPLNSDPGGR